ncbi:thioredoxin [Acetobacter estunensis NRIC 0472]|uniref:Tetratricopeptide repeat protein n=1 Tax=Acetobacter estunensis TaxID=104097 RepID=A0A967B780_9PROT|nr:tetratricopeptide repeat protein [Acetobacter estunensis]NHO53341.1 tetratricopeptide repeat protein [Acetobacter estunensis]GBQ22117.1 thioredoxin [Acetobacter estunensis NRIC 0472]
MDYMIGQKPPAQPGSGAVSGDIVMDGSEANFVQAVIETSRKVPVLVDFWADWCGPCKQLAPVLERVVNAAKGRVRLVKIDIEANRALAAQLVQAGLPLQSIPMVAAFWKGQILDLFQGAQPESQIKQFVERVLKAAGSGAMPSADMLAEAHVAMETQQPARAAELCSAVLEDEPENPAAWGGLIRAMLALDNEEAAADALADVPKAIATHPEVEGARAAVELKREGRQVAGEADALRHRIKANPEDFQARYDLANALNVAGHHEEAANELLAIIKKDQSWNEGAAKQLLFKFFEAWGHDDPATVQARRRLSSFLFA